MAGVGRWTVYGRVGSKDEVVEGVMMREVYRIFAAVGAATAGIDDVGEMVVHAFAAGLGEIRRNALFRRVLAVEPEDALPYMTLDAGPVLAAARRFLAEMIRRGGGSGGGRDP